MAEAAVPSLWYFGMRKKRNETKRETMRQVVWPAKEYICGLRIRYDITMTYLLIAQTPSPKNVERVIYEHVDREKSSVFIMLTT